MNIFHFTYAKPKYNIGDAPGVIDYFLATDCLINANEKFMEFSNGVEYDNYWIYDRQMEDRDIFERVLPLSSVEGALQDALKKNEEWLEEVIAQRQKERLNDVVVDGAAARVRKI